MRVVFVDASRVSILVHQPSRTCNYTTK